MNRINNIIKQLSSINTISSKKGETNYETFFHIRHTWFSLLFK